ncbi:group 1 glycosyl transferase [Stappia sp. 22II-S9-Z10]|nr:group 1 glycosyl transferase [Stappia sp. 22II-S9-Z10]
MRLAVLLSHPIQYYAPILRALAGRVDTHVFFAHMPTPQQQGGDFGAAFSWDVDLTGGFSSSVLDNVAPDPDVDRFAGADTPGIGARLDAFRPDAVLSFGWYLKSFVQGIAAAKLRGIPVAVRGDSILPRTHTGGPKPFAKALAYPLLLRALDAAFYVGAESRAYYRHFRYPEARLFFSPHAVDTEFFAERATEGARAALRAHLAIPPAASVVLFAGKLVAHKQPLTVVEATARLAADGLASHVLVAGSGALEGEVAARAAALGLPLHMLGFRNQSEMPEAYAAADVLALPSAETWGLVCNEAIAAGRPVVVSDAAGCAPDLAVEGVSGAIHPFGDVAAMAKALGRVLVAPPPAASLRRVSDAHSIAAASEGILAGLEATLARRGRSRSR